MPRPSIHKKDGIICSTCMARKTRTFACLRIDTNIHINGHLTGKSSNRVLGSLGFQSIGILFASNQLYISANKGAKWEESIDNVVIEKSVSVPIGEDRIWRSKDTWLKI